MFRQLFNCIARAGRQMCSLEVLFSSITHENDWCPYSGHSGMGIRLNLDGMEIEFGTERNNYNKVHSSASVALARLNVHVNSLVCVLV